MPRVRLGSLYNRSQRLFELLRGTERFISASLPAQLIV